MITQIRLNNFKAFTEVNLDIRPLTLFTGKNGMGKSTFIQSLLLLRQSYMLDKTLSELTLNGALTTIGYGKDLLNIYGGDTISIDIQFSKGKPYSYAYDAIVNSDKLKRINVPESVEEIGDQALFSNHFQYLNAERIVPQRTYEASPYAVNVLKTIGENGQFAVHFLDTYKFDVIPNLELKHVKAKSNTLLENVDAWLSEISSEVRVKPRFHPDLQISTLSFEFIDQTDTTPEFTSLNTGFGLTYVLPVIIVILSAQKGDLLIIENPESHLHPKGQAILGNLIALAASVGVQLIIESHSDHLFNGMRVAIKNKILKPNDFAVYFFSRDTEEHDIIVDQPFIDIRGRLSYQPNDFFDEYSKQLTQIIQNNKD